MRRIVVWGLFALLFVTPLNAAPDNDALTVRRIARLWEDRDKGSLRPIIRQQIQHYLRTASASTYHDNMYLMLGELDLLDNQVERALVHYGRVSGDEHRIQALERKLYCLGVMKDWDAVIAAVDQLESSGRNLRNPGNDAETQALCATAAEALFHVGRSTSDETLRASALKRSRRYLDALERCAPSPSTLQRLAAVQESLGDHPAAAETYLKLTTTDYPRRDNYRLEAARLQARFDKALALETLTTGDLPTPGHSLLAAALWYDTHDFQAVITNREKLLVPVVDPEQRVDLLIVIANAAVRLNDLSKARAALSEADELLEKIPQQKVQKLLLTTVVCHQTFQNHNDTIAAIDRLVTAFPDFADSEQVILAKAWALAKTNRSTEAQVLLQHTIKNGSDPTIIERARYELARLLHERGQWDESHQALKEYIALFPEGRFTVHAKKLMIETMLAAATDAEDTDLKQECSDRIFDTLRNLSLPPKEHTPYLLSISQGLITAKCYPLAEKILNRLPSDVPVETAAQIHLLRAACALEGRGDRVAYCDHIAKGLELNPSIPNRAPLLLSLFSTHLQLSRDGIDPEYHEAAAARHLYAAAISDQAPVDANNLLWLAHRFSSRLSEVIDSNGYQAPLRGKEQRIAVRAVQVYEVLFASEVSIDREDDLLTLVNLYLALEDTDKAYRLLTTIDRRYEAQEAESPNRDKILYRLATLELAKGKKSDARRRLRAIASRSTSRDKAFAPLAARLELARLDYQRVRDLQKSTRDSKVSEVIKELERLQRRRAPETEPIHLEAGIEHAIILGDQRGVAAQVKALQTLKQKITATKTIRDKDFHTRLDQLPTKRAIFQSYTMLIDAEIARLQAEQAKEQGNLAVLNHKARAAQTIYQTLVEGRLAVSPFLVEHARRGLSSTEAIAHQQFELFPAGSPLALPDAGG